MKNENVSKTTLTVNNQPLEINDNFRVEEFMSPTLFFTVWIDIHIYIYKVYKHVSIYQKWLKYLLF